jgi:hypothetical protein
VAYLQELDEKARRDKEQLLRDHAMALVFLNKTLPFAF